MQDIIAVWFYRGVLKYLEDVLGYDFIAEVFELYEHHEDNRVSVSIGYRGHQGEYGKLNIGNLSAAEILKAVQ